MKKLMVQFNIPGMTALQFDQCWEELRNVGHTNPTGRSFHVAGPQGNDWVVVDVWESEEAFNKFGEILMPILGKLGVNLVPPVITPVHYVHIGA